MTEIKHKNAAEQMGYTVMPNAVMLDPTLTVQAKFLYAILKYFAWHGVAPGQQRLGEILKLSTRSVREYLTELEQHGLVTRTRRGLRQANVYTIIQPTAVHRLSDRKLTADQDGKYTANSTKNYVSTNKEQASGSVSPYPPDVTDEDLEAGRAEIQRFRSGGSG